MNNKTRECFICGSDNAQDEKHVKPILIDGMCYEDVCGYCEEAGLHEEETA
jgi:hypothetical protein